MMEQVANPVAGRMDDCATHRAAVLREQVSSMAEARAPAAMDDGDDD